MPSIPHAHRLAALLLTAALTSAACTADDEPDFIYVNEASGEGTATVVVGQGLQGTLDPGGDEDRFSVTLRAGDLLSVYVDRDLQEGTSVTWTADGEDLRTAYGLRSGEVFHLFAHKDGAYTLTLYGSPQTATPYSLQLQSAAPIEALAVTGLPAEHTSSDRDVLAFNPTVPAGDLLIATLQTDDASGPPAAYGSVLLWSRETQQLRVMEYTSAPSLDLPYNTVGERPAAGELLLLSPSSLQREAVDLTLSLRTLDDTPVFPAADPANDPDATGALTAGDIDFIRLPEPLGRDIYRVEATSPSGADLTLTLALGDGQPALTATTQDGTAALEFELDSQTYYIPTLQIATADGAAGDYKLSLQTTTWDADAPLDLQAEAPVTGDTPQGSWAWRSVTTDAPALLLSRLDANSRAAAISQSADATLDPSWYASDSPNLVALITPDDNPTLWGVRHATFRSDTFTLEHAALIPLTAIPDDQIAYVEPSSTLNLPAGPALVEGYPNDSAQDFSLTIPLPANQRVLVYANISGADTMRFAPSPADVVAHTYHGSSRYGQQLAWELQGGAQDTTVTFALEGECTLVTDQNAVVYTCPVDAFLLRVEPLQ